ncbi:hypothetical protein ACFLYJ_03315 [Candidatus Cloacimonadota bacterium]
MILFAFCSSLFSYNFFSPSILQERLNVVYENQTFQLKKQPIINSEKVYRDSIQFSKNHDYQIDYSSSSITFFDPIGNLTIEYNIYPEELKQKFFLFEEQEYSEDKELKLPKRKKSFFSNEANLKISGSKTISVSVANNEDFSLDQSLFLKIDGELSSNLNIEAQLSDSQSPITPEGDSREISSLDKVFLRLYSKRYEIAFGDLEMKFEDTEFMDYNPKFEGLRAGWFGKNKFEGALAISKGKNTTIQFNGLEAKQGPYYIFTGEQQSIQVVPGTEEVWLNGSRMQRGDDYTIDYSEGSITFSNQHFISSTSFIQVSFQYADEYFKQNMYLASSDVKVTDRLSVRNFLIIQSDDKDNPLQNEYDNDDIDVLKNAGDGQAWGSGVYAVEDGLYELDPAGFYYYVGNDSTQTGSYDIHFEFIGELQGDYDYNSNDDFYFFVGTDQGSYLPVRKLTAPQNKSNYDLALKYEGEIFSVKAEGIFTALDQNTYSSKDDNDNNAYATDLGVDLFPDYDLLSPKLYLGFRSSSENLNTFADITDPVDNYESMQIPDSLASQEYTGKLSLKLFNFYEPSLKFKTSQISDYADQNYFVLTSRFYQKKFFPAVYHQYSDFKKEQNAGQNSEFQLNDLRLNKELGKFNFKFDHYNKKSENDVVSVNYLQTLRNWKYAVETVRSKKITAQIFMNQELQKLESEYADSTITTTNKEISTVGLSSILNFSDHYLKANISHRIVKDLTSDKSTEFDLAEISTRNSFFQKSLSLNSSYALKNVEFYPKIKAFQYVGDNMGSYDEDSTHVGFGAGDYDWEIVEIDYENPEMSVELNANFSLNLNPKLITKTYFRKFQSETNLQISENSTEEDKYKVYYLDPTVLMQKDSTLYGRILVQQTLWYNLIDNKVTTKIRYKQEKTLDNRYNSQTEKTFKSSWEGTCRITSFKNTNYEIFFEKSLQEESIYGSETNLYSGTLDIRYQMNKDLLLNTSMLYSREDDDTNDYKISSYGVEETITYYLKKKYRLFARFSYKRNNREGSQFLSFLADKKDGNIFKWNLNVNYRVNSYTSAKLEYTGNSYPQQKDEHKISVEIKAEF